MSTAARITSTALAVTIDGPDVTGRQWTIDSAYGYCERLARSHYENFPVGSVLIPKRLRKHFYSIYAFARVADDFADEGYGQGYSEDERHELLDEWRRMLNKSLAGRASHPVFVALAQTASEFDLPGTPFED